MKTLGLHKKSSLHTWGLRGFISIISSGWKEIIQFTVYINRKISLKVKI